jgi:hypothetical protein
MAGFAVEALVIQRKRGLQTRKPCRYFGAIAAYMCTIALGFLGLPLCPACDTLSQTSLCTLMGTRTISGNLQDLAF